MNLYKKSQNNLVSNLLFMLCCLEKWAILQMRGVGTYVQMHITEEHHCLLYLYVENLNFPYFLYNGFADLVFYVYYCNQIEGVFR